MTVLYAIFLLGPFVEPPLESYLAVLDKMESRLLLRRAEEDMASQRKRYRPVHRLVIDEVTGERYPYTEFVEDPGSPLRDRIVTLRLRLEELITIEDWAPPGSEVDIETLTPREKMKLELGERFVLRCSVKANLERLFELCHIDPQAASSLAAHSRRAEALRSEIKELRKEERRVARERSEPRATVSIHGPLPRGARKVSPPGRRPTEFRSSNRSYFRNPRPYRRYQRARIIVGGTAGASRSTTRRGCDPRPAVRAYEEPTYSEDEEALQRTRRRRAEAQEERGAVRERIADTRRSVREEMHNARHELFLLVPRGFELPQRLPRHFEAVVWIEVVEWDRAADLPTLIMHGDLLESQELGLTPSRSQWP